MSPILFVQYQFERYVLRWPTPAATFVSINPTHPLGAPFRYAVVAPTAIPNPCSTTALDPASLPRAATMRLTLILSNPNPTPATIVPDVSNGADTPSMLARSLATGQHWWLPLRFASSAVPGGGTDRGAMVWSFAGGPARAGHADVYELDLQMTIQVASGYMLGQGFCPLYVKVAPSG